MRRVKGMTIKNVTDWLPGLDFKVHIFFKSLQVFFFVQMCGTLRIFVCWSIQSYICEGVNWFFYMYLSFLVKIIFRFFIRHSKNCSTYFYFRSGSFLFYLILFLLSWMVKNWKKWRNDFLIYECQGINF